MNEAYIKCDTIECNMFVIVFLGTLYVYYEVYPRSQLWDKRTVAPAETPYMMLRRQRIH